MKKTIPAQSGETMQYMVHNCNDNTIRFVLHYPGMLDREALKTAAGALIGSVDVLHGSYIPGRFRAKWNIHTDIGDDEFFREVRSEALFETAAELALAPVLPESKAQVRVELVHNDRESCLVFGVSHLVADGRDSLYLLEKLCQAYERIRKEGTLAGFSVKNGSRAPEQAYAHLDKKAVRSLMKNPVPAVKTVFPFPSGSPALPSMVHRSVSRETMAAARARGKAFGATANDILLAAAYTALAGTPGIGSSEGMSIMSMVDLRQNCPGGGKEGLANLSGSMPTVIRPGSEDFTEILQDVAGQTARAKADPLAGLAGLPLLHMLIRRMPNGLLLAAAEKFYGSMSVGLTNLGNLDRNKYVLDGIRPDGGWFSGPVKKKPAMQISAVSFDGTCVLSAAGDFNPEDRAILADFLDRMEQSIEQFTK